MASRTLKKQIYEELSEITSAMSSALRMEMLEILVQGQHSVEAIANETGLTMANASQHLQKMKNARLVTAEKHGKQTFYQLADYQVYQLLESLIDLGFARSAELQNLLKELKGGGENLETIDVNTLKKRLDQKAVFLVDVRPEEEYQNGHIPGAKSIPLDSLQNQLEKLPKDKEIVAYCRGSLCTMSDEAIKLLRENGYEARNFTRGLPEWQANGMAVENG